jgi:hypothetical protein
MRLLIGLIIVIMFTIWWTRPVIDIGEPLVIHAPDPTPVDHPRPTVIEQAKDLFDFRQTIWTYPIPDDDWPLVDEAKPETLRELFERYFHPEDVDLMWKVSWCESRHRSDAANPTSSARGLFQHLKGWYTGAWGHTGPFNPYDAEESVRAAAVLLYDTRAGIRHWDASRHCWGDT